MDNLITNCGLVALRNVDSLKSVSVRTLINLAEDNGVKLYAYKVPVNELHSVKLPAIFHATNHFVYISSVSQLKDFDLTGNVLLTEELGGEYVCNNDLKNITGETWVAAGVATVGIGVGVYQHSQAKKALKNLQNQEMPQYTMSPESRNYYDTVRQQAQGGFSNAETAAFKQNLAQQQNAGYQQAIQQSGGNLGQALSTGLQAQNIGALNQFAGQDAQLHRQNIAQLGAATGDVQGQYNLINQQKIQRRTMLEQAYGQAMQAGLSNMYGGLQAGGNAVNYSLANNQSGGQSQVGMGQSFGGPSDPSLGNGSWPTQSWK